MMIIDYAKGKFLISCPFSHNDLVRSLPNRRWRKSDRLWVAPAIKPNVKMVKQFISESNARGSVECNKFLSEYVDAKPTSKSVGFPAWFNFKTKPRKKQMEVLNFAYDLPASAMFLAMRVGKSKVMIDIASAYFIEGKTKAMVVIVQKTLRGNWLDQLKQHCSIEYDFAKMDTSKPEAFKKWADADLGDKLKVLTVSVESLGVGSAKKMLSYFLRVNPESMCVVDESSKIKNHKALRTEACIDVGREAKYRTILTGTPISQGIVDLFAQYEFLDTNIIGMGDFYAFRNRYAVMGGYENKEIIGYTNTDELMELIAPYTIQVSKKEAFEDSIEPNREVRYIEMTAEQKAHLKAMRKAATAEDYSVRNVLEAMMREQQLCGGFYTKVRFEFGKVFSKEVGCEIDAEIRIPEKFRIEGTNPKISELFDIIDSGEYGEQILIWSIYTDEIREITRSLGEKYGEDSVTFIDGSVDEDERIHRVNDLFKFGKVKYLIANPTVGSMGLEMSAADTAVYYSSSFKYEDRKQSEERTFNSSKTKADTIVDLVMINGDKQTSDGDVLEAIGNKQNVSDFVKSRINELKNRN